MARTLAACLQREQPRNQVICCTAEKVLEAQLTHPSGVIALLLHFFHYCYSLPFQYRRLGVRVPIEFTLWPSGEHFFPPLLHELLFYILLSMPSPQLSPSELFGSSLKNGNNDLPRKHTASVKMLQGIIL